MTIKDIISKHQRYYGTGHIDQVFEKTVEEMAELIVEIQHYKQSRSSTIPIELVQVCFCLEFLKDYFLDKEEFEKMFQEEIENLSKRLNENDN